MGSPVLTLAIFLLSLVPISAEMECTRVTVADDDPRFDFEQSDQSLNTENLQVLLKQIVAEYVDSPVLRTTVDYSPILKHIVGEFTIRAEIELDDGDANTEKCFDIVINIKDTDECSHNVHPEWTAACHHSTMCINTNGSYYCACTANNFSVPMKGLPGCNEGKDSRDCCGDTISDGVHNHTFEACRRDFKCHSDSCASSGNDCHEDAVCIPLNTPNTFTCRCKDGYRDVSYDDKMPGRACEFVDHCVPNACPSGCKCESITNGTHDGFVCNAVSGYTSYYPTYEYEWATKPETNRLRLDKEPHVCVSQVRPTLILEGGQKIHMMQGDTYEESGVTIIDNGTANMKRRFTTDYSQAEELMHGPVMKCGSYFISYAIQTPWIKDLPNVTMTREVVVSDFDECSTAAAQHECHFPARCENRLCKTGEDPPGGPGPTTYECVCYGEGFVPDSHQGCLDTRHEAAKPSHKERTQALDEAMDLIAWHFHDLPHEAVKKYKRLISHLHEKAHGINMN